MPQQVDVDKLTFNQKLAYNIVKRHFLEKQNEQLLLIITGLAETGKSYLIETIRYLLQKKCLTLAYFGIAAFHIDGSTLHKILQLPIGPKRRV